MLVGLSDAASERAVQQEIKIFLEALSSYPDHFAQEPRLSFEQHLFSVTAANRQSAFFGERRKHWH